MDTGSVAAQRSRIVDAAGLAAWLVVTFAAAALGGWATASSLGEWYATLAKPAWTPPDGVFGPVWTVLYALMAVAAWWVWRSGTAAETAPALGAYSVQLLLNLGWSVVFFGLRMPGAAVLEIALLWLAIAATMVLFYRQRPLAGLLLTPYLAWVTFAGVLNFAIWRLNAG